MNKNLPFTSQTKMADVIHMDYRLIPIIGRFGIDYGFSNKTVFEVCKQHDINVWFFLAIINSYHNHKYFPEKQLQNFNVQLIIHYLSRTHAYYLNSKVPDIEGCIEEMKKQSTDANFQNVNLLSNFFEQYKVELKKHLDKEDYVVFPYVISLEQALESKQIDAELIQRVKEQPIEEYERSHENMEVKLSDLKNLIIRHLPPVLCKDSCQKLLTELFRLEADLENHSRIEDNVLIPKVKLLEQKILDASGTK
ncbi:regulator of cell morphogenesis and NO signaling [Saccharicrinis carchari]|uniref:Regulator of cell morphogenesis and NO signaling n=1 Tax=Saccharicrinis carchari TaxID=1168039 RepID=A0A521E145_SACCC|nr:hemerythrin domain-containing protein [Saccharicrinis carchari]SMO76840.1 regulator of cell morphogenesis and NO signaling [Saccharicrinis carchari]